MTVVSAYIAASGVYQDPCRMTTYGKGDRELVGRPEAFETATIRTIPEHSQIST